MTSPRMTEALAAIDAERDKAIKALKKEKSDLIYNATCDVLDLAIPSNNLDYFPFGAGITGACGSITSLMGLCIKNLLI